MGQRETGESDMPVSASAQPPTVTRSVPDNSKATAERVPASPLPSGPVQRTLPKALGFSSQGSTVITKRQRNVLYGLMVTLAASLILWPRNTIISLVLIITAIYLATSVYRLYLAWTGLRTGGGIQVGADETNVLIDDDLPSYTLLVPLYRETSVLPGLTKSLGNLDYPKDKIEIFLLLEEDDLDTTAAARASNLPAQFRIVVPDGIPKSKPRACNFGLTKTTSDYTVIYDAEDMPEPDQLKKVISVFQRLGPSIGCVQCKLNYYNQGQNRLTQ